MTTSNILSQLGSPGVSTGMKNRIINGSMVINQRNGSPYTVSGGGAVYTVDRFYGQATSGSFTVTQSSTAPTGFNNSLLVNVTSAVTSPASTDVFVVSQIIEGYNIADLQEGTANGKSFTISFWVKSNLTGTFCVGVRSSSGDYGYAATYTISSANTWQFVSVTIPPTTSGTWVTNNTQGMYILFDMGSGSNRNITANTWTAGSGFNTSSQTNVMASTSNNFAITGVQLEVGTNATNFEYLDYGRSLIQCQRYYVDLANNGGATQNTYRAIGFASTYSTTQGSYVVQVPVPMRTLPTLTQAGTMYLQNLGSTSISSFAGPYSIAGTIVEGDFTMVSAVASNSPGILRWNSSSTQKFAYSAEL